MADTLCWKCARSYGQNQCSWASGFQPIPGWDATATTVKGIGPPYNSYFIKACPEFIPESSRTTEDVILMALETATYTQGYVSEVALYNVYRRLSMDCNLPIYNRTTLRDAIKAMECCTIARGEGRAGKLYCPKQMDFTRKRRKEAGK